KPIYGKVAREGFLARRHGLARQLPPLPERKRNLPHSRLRKKLLPRRLFHGQEGFVHPGPERFNPGAQILRLGPGGLGALVRNVLSRRARRKRPKLMAAFLALLQLEDNLGQSLREERAAPCATLFFPAGALAQAQAFYFPGELACQVFNLGRRGLKGRPVHPTRKDRFEIPNKAERR